LIDFADAGLVAFVPLSLSLSVSLSLSLSLSLLQFSSSSPLLSLLFFFSRGEEERRETRERMMGRFYFAKDDPALKKKASKKKAGHSESLGNKSVILRMPVALEDVWATGFWRTFFQQDSTQVRLSNIVFTLPVFL